ncbi:hypothetical protein F5883DRAFT_140722 [Diaporthe sp. PMI_573]|nr:hypothetical protein F5883DRAFT_140722 [Diaporthaceae sp. PMI_573]
MNTMSNQRGKRKRGDDDEKKPSKQKTKLDSDQCADPFACPFYLHNRYEWHTCLRNYTLKRIVDVRLHLLRVHLLAPQCPTCGHEFKGDSAEDRCNVHIQLRTCQPLPLPLPSRHGVTGDQLEDIRTIATRRPDRRVKDPAAAKWFEMWDIIFPSSARPASPYNTEQPDVQRTRDLNELILSSERWRDVIIPTRESSPSLQNASRSTVAAIAHGLEASYRRIYRDLDRPTPEVASNTVADTPMSSSMDASLPPSQGWEVLPSSSQPVQATEDPLPPGHPATGPDQWMFQQTHGYLSSDRRSQNNPMAPGSQSLSPFPSDPYFLTDAQIQGSTGDFPDDDFLGNLVEPGSPSQCFMDNYGSSSSGL